MLSFVRAVAISLRSRFIFFRETLELNRAMLPATSSRVPDVDVPHRREVRHCLAVLPDGVGHDGTPRALGVAELPTGDREAAASRLMSHSNGPRSVSSKSLIEKTSRRSGAANTPKFDRWASPHS